MEMSCMQMNANAAHASSFAGLIKSNWCWKSPSTESGHWGDAPFEYIEFEKNVAQVSIGIKSVGGASFRQN